MLSDGRRIASNQDRFYGNVHDADIFFVDQIVNNGKAGIGLIIIIGVHRV